MGAGTIEEAVVCSREARAQNVMMVVVVYVQGCKIRGLVGRSVSE